MAYPDGFTARWTRLLHRVYARLSARARPAGGFVSQPEPRTVGSFARGRQLVAGNYLFAGYLIEAEDAGIWDVAPPAPTFEDELHGFAWLDDLAAVGDAAARACAQEWLWTWIDRFGKGRGPGWTPDLTGRRMIRWIHHAVFLLRGQDQAASRAFFRSLAHQTIFLSRRWGATAPGLPRFEALTGLIYAGLSLQGMERHVAPATRALERECRRQVDAHGGIPTRNPEELLEVFTLLTWAAAALDEVGQPVQPELRAAIDRIAPTLRTLRHADGGLARFHGGGRGLDGRLDSALASSMVKSRAQDGLSMGFARLSAGRTSIIVDAAQPPTGTASRDAHASTLAFELTSGRRPVIVNCGSGASFGQEWRRAGRATASHSTLSLAGYSSARLGTGGKRGDWLSDAPRDVPVEISHAADGLRLQAGHDGYVRTHGLIHARTLDLTFDGRGVAGEDMLLALDDKAHATFDRAMEDARLQGIPFDIRFHLHPEVDATIDMGGAAISLALKSGELWVFRHDASAEMHLEASVYLEKGRLRPRATKQIVLSARAMDYATRIRWSLAKAQDTPISIRDVHRDELDLTD
ncbi:heparinase II/III family protein [Lutimaribacter sp. EGI FJ00015]|uniref:Heparinase II/III family protein n=1 Tax=Lutimaribacter degradans TaxID=2945989 RepID=A0ACC5ZYN5_9RHOB|nr:heparinase II/III family protein [Lutimaribacter sp. EGI FJ00013]MCM2563417.1 heparinase II/III family protein [Lutimaribacter sp. EGI FJ00013]MCO0614505.1 heparinase II/III family protein [Lutimaribacter sp. EGI FJ00015]MCO0637178.1 heparinase II/III family protein [Lutimaribacter sp. EGI FJ00014]